MNRETPTALGYRMPAEWEPHHSTWLSWPHNEDSWPGKFEPIPSVFTLIAKHLAESEQVDINVVDLAMEYNARALLERAGLSADRIRFHTIPTNDAWARDHGPIFVRRSCNGEGELAIVNWGYNAWGEKYPPFDLDNQVPERIAAMLGLRIFEPGMVLEGGSIDVNGAGTLMTTESCLLNPNRNPGLTRPEIEQRLKDFLGVVHVIWLGEGIEGDDTDGHVDDLARFVDRSTVVTVLESDSADTNYRPLQDNLRRLTLATDQDGRPLTIVTLPMPACVEYKGQRLPASYANFYIANRVVLVPTFNQPTDAAAIEILQKLFPQRRVVGLYCLDLIWGLGAVHCVTQQQPAL